MYQNKNQIRYYTNLFIKNQNIDLLVNDRYNNKLLFLNNNFIFFDFNKPPDFICKNIFCI